MYVMVVDDNETTQKRSIKILDKFQVSGQTFIYHSGQKAVDHAMCNPVDLAFVRRKLPDLSGEVQMTSALPENTDEDFKEWFDGNIVWSYFDSAYPWTRLGYTYDWAADAEDEYGLSEFLVKDGSEVTVAYTSTTDEFLQQLNDGSWIPEEAVDSKFI